MSAFDYDLEKLIRNPSFNRWVQGKASEQERKLWDEWVAEDLSNRTLAMRAQEKIEGFVIDSSIETSTEEAWKRIRNRLGEDHKIQKQSFRSSADGLTWIYRIAAAILLIITSSILITQFYHTPTDASPELIETEVTTQYGVRKTVSLSDGSKIILNSNSRMKYTIDRNDPTSVDLFLEGEAYFSVSKRGKPFATPFQIRTNDGLVKVLGTQLVVSTHNDRTRVILEEGRVSVNPFHSDSATILKPGQLMEFDNNSDSVKTRFVSLQLYTSWVKGQLNFEKTPVRELANRLEEIFGVEVVLRNSSLCKNKISGAIEGEKLEIITSALSEILSTCVQKSDTENVVYIGCYKE